MLLVANSVSLHQRDTLSLSTHAMVYPRMDMRIPANAKMDKCPHAFLTADSPWDPLALNNKSEEKLCDTVMELSEVKEKHDGADPLVDGCLFFCGLVKIMSHFSVRKMNSLQQMQT